jgi:lysophospholipase L1-like esterase
MEMRIKRTPQTEAITKPGQGVGRAKRNFPRFRITIFLCLALLVGGYLYFYCYLPVGSGPAGPAVSAESFAKPWTQRKVLLVGLGDSVTAGYGVPKGYGYFDRLATNTPDEFADMKGLCLSSTIPQLSVLNLAVSGSNSFHHLQRQISSLKPQDVDVLGLVVMTTGGNDIIHDYGRSPPREGAMYGATIEQAEPWVANFRARLEEMVRQLRGKFPGGCHIFIADIYDPTDGAGVPWLVPYPDWKDSTEILRQYNRVIHDVCREQKDVHLVPMHDALLGHGFCCRRVWKGCYRWEDPTYWYAPNIEDPNARGYDAIRRLFLLEIAKTMR